MKRTGFGSGALVGLGLGVGVTLHSHRKPSSPFWVGPVLGSRLRWTNMPVGGILAALVALGLCRIGWHSAAKVAAGIALGAAVGALGTGLVDPLPVAGLDR